MNIHFFRVFIFEFSLNRPNCRCVCMFMYWFVCVFFFRSVCELKSINGPNVPIVFRIYLFCTTVCAFYFSLCPSLVSLVCSLFLSVFGPVAMASLNFCAYRVRTSTAKIYNKTVLLLRLLLLLPLLAATIWIHGFSRSFLHPKFIFLFRSSWTPVTFANLQNFFFLSLLLRYSVAFILFRSTHSLGERCLELSVCDLAHAHTAKKSAHDHSRKRRRRENYFCKCEKSHTYTGTAHAYEQPYAFANSKSKSKWACEQDAKSKK